MLIKHLINLELAIISAHVPCHHMWVRVGPGLSSSSPKHSGSQTVGDSGSGMVVLKFTTVSARDGAKPILSLLQHDLFNNVYSEDNLSICACLFE